VDSMPIYYASWTNVDATPGHHRQYNPMHMNSHQRCNSKQSLNNRRGFSMVEVMVALVVLSTGLLGIAKVQALAYSSTATASKRSLAAMEASSLAAAMRANRLYWSTASAPNPLTITSSGSTPTISDATLGTAINCVFGTTGSVAPCTTAQMAAYDLQQWAASLSALLPNAGADIRCPLNTPVICTITISWDEKTVAVNQQASAFNQSAPVQSTTYKLFVEP
jgi:type IV pilus assembly protein PilV